MEMRRTEGVKGEDKEGFIRRCWVQPCEGKATQRHANHQISEMYAAPAQTGLCFHTVSVVSCINYGRDGFSRQINAVLINTQYPVRV